MAFVYGVLGVIVVLTASTFGTINASPWFNLGIAVLFVVLALASALVVSLQKPWTRIAVRVAGSWVAAVGLLMAGWGIRAALA